MIGERLASLDPDTGDRPSSRIGNAGNARQLVERLKYEDQTRMYRYTRIMGLLDGNPPWPQKKLTDLGQGHRANFNLREGEGMVDAAKTPYYDLVFEVPQFAQVTLIDIPGADQQLLKEWGGIISEEYHETLSAWPGFDQNIQLHQWQFVVNGVGPIFWPHAISWHSEAVKTRKVLVPQETKANVDDLEICVVLHSYRADELESYVAGSNGQKDGYSGGWNVPLVRQAVIDSAVRDLRQQYGIENYDLYQRAIRTGDLFYGIHRSDRVYVASLFVREFGGKVSHYMIVDSMLGEETNLYTGNLEEEEGYLYRAKGKYDDFTQVLCPFFFDTGPDGTWHAVKGLGTKIYDFCDVSNRMFCQMLDGAVIGSGITLEAQDANAIEETQIVLTGGATVVSPGYKVVQTRIAESLQGAMAMRRELQGTLQSNTGSYRQRVAEENQEPTLGQAQMNWQQQGLLNKGATNRYYNTLDRYHTETLRRLLDPAAHHRNVPGGLEAAKFFARCLMRGVPERILDFNMILKVRSERSLGYGSPQIRDMATKELINLIPLMDEVSRNHALRMRAAALPGIGMSGVDAVFPKIEQQQVPNLHMSQATDENNALRTIGGQALVEPSQNHSIHFNTHMGDVQAHQQSAQQSGEDPHMLLVHMEQAGAHMAQHLQKLQGDPTRKNEVKQKKTALDQLGKQTDQLQQQVDDQTKAMADQQQTDQANAAGQPDPEAMAKILKVQGDTALKAKKQASDLALKVHAHKVQQDLADKKTAADIARKNAEAFQTPPPQAF
jgi:hypothetical protein